MWRGLLKSIAKVIKFLYAPIMCFSLAVIILTAYANTKHTLEYKESTLTHIEYDSTRPNYITKEYIKSEVDSLFSGCNYILRYKDLASGIGGVSYIMLKLVYLDINLTLEDYVLTLTHELVHITYFTANERFTTFKAFQILYESGNEYFKNVALAYANLQFNHCVPYVYDCSGYIEDYLHKELENAINQKQKQTSIKEKHSG